MREIVYEKVPYPKDEIFYDIELTDETIKERYEKVLTAMKLNNLDCLIIYADKEHGSNFEYLTGFYPRFEEALLIIHKEKNYLLLGNENMKMSKVARIKNKAICTPYFSLPNQPMENKVGFEELLKKADIKKGLQIGMIGWKHFTSRFEDNKELFEIPYYIVETVKKIVTNEGSVKNYSNIFLKEVRTINNANEIVHYLYGASLASNCILNVMKKINVGMNDLEMAELLEKYGQPHTTVSIFASGDRYYHANLFPKNKNINIGDKISMSVGYKGGLSCRNGFAVENEKQLPENQNDYLEKVVIPYFNCYVEWLEKIKIGMDGKEIYDIVEKTLPKEIFKWSLNPGHLTSDEEWLSSPIYEDSNEIIKSGMIFQIDIILTVTGYSGINCEETIALADENLRNEIKKGYPEVWSIIVKRREFIIKTLNIKISEEILPLSNAVAYLNPYLLNKEYALRVK